jgi:hypothetical protein
MKLATSVLVFAATALPAGAAITNVRIGGSTATQAIVAYTASTSAACALVISESPTYSPVVHDVDATLFPGANLDSRAGNPTAGLARTFVVGQRLAAQGADGNYYSRALQANTQHWFQIACGTDTATGTFTTANLPIGDSSVEQPPFDAGAPFNYAWPSVSLTDKTKTYVDPQTGVLLKRMTGPGENTAGTHAAAFSPTVFDLNSAWTNPNNASSGNPGTLATYSGVASDPLVLTFPTNWNPTYTTPGGWFATGGVDDLQVTAYGDGSDASSANRTIGMCWTPDDGVTCATNTLTVVLPQTTPGTVSTTGFPSSTMSEWGAYLSKGLFFPRTGKVNVSGTAVTWASGAYFNPALAVGSRFYIAGASACASNYCTIASMQSTSALTTVESNSTLTNATYFDAAPGLKIWKTTAPGTVNVSFSFTTATGGYFTMDVGGEFDSCGHNSVTVSVDAGGNAISPSVTGYLCIARWGQDSHGGALYLIIPSTGESRLLSNFIGTRNTGDPTADQIYSSDLIIPSGLNFDSTDSTVMYYALLVNGIGGNHVQSIFKIHYTGTFAAWTPVYSGTVPADHVTYTNLTPASTGMDILSQIQAAFPSYSTTLWGTFYNNSGLGMAGKYFVVSAGPGQDAPCIYYYFDTSQMPAPFVKSADSFSAASLRWSGCHTTDVAGFGDYGMIGGKQMADNPTTATNFLGPWQMPVVKVMQNGSWTTNTAVAANYYDTCPGGASVVGPWNATPQCITIMTSGEPCSHTPSAAELASYPCPYNASYSTLLGQTTAVGDWLVDLSTLSTNGERMQILSKTNNGDGTVTFVLERGVGPCAGNVAKSNGWTVAMAVNNGTCRINTFFNSGSDVTNTWVAENGTLVAGHNDIGTAPTAGNITVAGNPWDIYYGYGIRFNKPTSSIGQPGDWEINFGNTHFANNQVGTTSGIQSYPSLKQWNAPAREKVWFLDVRAILPSGGVGDEAVQKMMGGTSTLVPGLTQTYVTPIPSGIGTVSIKTTPLLGYAGPYLLQDISGPSSSIGDTNAWSYCYAYKAGECRAGSVAGTAYTNVPKAGPLDGCYVNSFSIRPPCVFMASPPTSQVVQWDLSQPDPLGTRYRKLGMGLAGWGRQYDYANARALPDGSWAILRGYWPDGKRSDLLLAKLPPWPNYDSANRSTFVPLPLQLGAVPWRTDHVLVQFGYTPNFQCTTRQEVCITVTGSAPGSAPAQVNETTPFYFATSDLGAYTGLPCTSGCTVTIPARPQRVVYYRVSYLRADGTTVLTTGTEVAVVP